MPDKLSLQTKTFEDVVRWGALEKMYLFLKQDPAQPPVQVQDGLDNVRVTGYESSQLGKISETRWAQTAVIDYVLTDRQVVRQLVDHQLWVSDDEGKTWYRENPVPLFR
ncbi:MAG TPA: hypothetical protein PKZ35_07885 [Gammaproteobacteria bacterium]|nr:hypothetical protein [Gammaproteobacteria bacterium]